MPHLQERDVDGTTVSGSQLSSSRTLSQELPIQEAKEGFLKGTDELPTMMMTTSQIQNSPVKVESFGSSQEPRRSVSEDSAASTPQAQHSNKSGVITPSPFVHRGMRNGAKEIYDALLPIMAKHPGDIIICGHSLGGGIATWLQIALKGAASAVHTFGSPRVLSYSSSKRFNLLMRDQHIRWVNGSDIVPRLLWWIYKHVGRMFFIDPGWDLLTNGDAEKSARYMRWRSIKSFGRKGFSEHSIEDYLMCIAHQCDQ